MGPYINHAFARRDEIRTVLCAKFHKPQPVLRAHIPKANNKKCPLGIPTMRDLEEWTAALPIFEADFEDCS